MNARGRLAIATFAAPAALLAVAAVLVRGPSRTPPTGIHPHHGLSFLIGDAEAASSPCPTGEFREEVAYQFEVPTNVPSGSGCTGGNYSNGDQAGNATKAYVPYLRTTYCDGTVAESQYSFPQGSNHPDWFSWDSDYCGVGSPDDQMSNDGWDDCSGTNQGVGPLCAIYRENPAPVRTTLCQTTDPTCLAEQPPCSEGAEASCPSCPVHNCVGHPVSVVGQSTGSALGQGALFHSIPIVPLGEAGFPKTLSLNLIGQTNYGPVGATGIRAMLNVLPSLEFIPGVPNVSPNEIRVITEDGVPIPFKETSPGVWTADDGRVATLTASDNPQCNIGAQAELSLPNGDRYTFNEYCYGNKLSEGQAVSVVRASGYAETFSTLLTPDTNAQLQWWVTNSHGYSVGIHLSYTGEILSVTAPGSDQIDFLYSNVPPGSTGERFLTSIQHHTTGTPIWNVAYVNNGGSQYALGSVSDGAGIVHDQWDYTDSQATRVEHEITADGEKLDFGTSYLAGQTNVTVRDSNNNARAAANTYVFATPTPGDPSLPRVISQTINAHCPNCGRSSGTYEYWPHTTYLLSAQDANGFFTIYAGGSTTSVDRSNQSLAYDASGNPLSIFSGCESSTTCTLGRQVTFAHYTDRTAGDVMSPSVVSGTLATTQRCFDDGSGTWVCDTDNAQTGRVLLVSRTGYTSSDVSHTNDVSKTRTTRFRYGGPTAGDLTEIDGPYWEPTTGAHTLSPPAGSPTTSLTYYATGTDTCGYTGALNRVATVQRTVASGATLVTTYCDYDGDGRPQIIAGPDGTAPGVKTALTYDWAGDVTKSVSDSGGLNYTVDYLYDNGRRLIGVRFPRVVETSYQSGYFYTYASSGRLSLVEHGCWDNLSNFQQATSANFHAQCPNSNLGEVASFVYDSFGNRTATLYEDGARNLLYSVQANYDPLDRASALVRPLAGADVTSYAYDSQNNLTNVHDGQGDYVNYYGDQGLGKYDRYGMIREVQQYQCDHGSSSDGSSCVTNGGAGYTSTIDFGYDLALQLSSVAVQNTSAGGHTGTITTGYTYDDFGELVKVDSPDTGTTTYTYDGAGRLSSYKDADLRTFGFTYDQIGRITQKTPPTDSPTKYCYDGANGACGGPSGASKGLLTFVSDNAGTIQYAYDNLHRLTTETRTLAGSSVLATTAYQYDGNGAGLLWNVQYSSGLKFSYQYDDLGHPAGVTWYFGSSNGTVLSAVAWSPFAGISSFKLGSALSNYQEAISRDAAGRITSINWYTGLFPRTLVHTLTYDYAHDGNVKATPSGAANVFHDSLNRTTGDRGATFTYDDAGNRTNGMQYVANNACPAGISTCDRASSGNSLSYGYNASGWITTRGGSPALTLGYFEDGTVKSIVNGSNTTTYTRDWLGERITVAGAAGSATYSYDPSGHMAHWTGPVTSSPVGCSLGQQWKQQNYEGYVWLDGRPVALVQAHAKSVCSFKGAPFSTFVVDNIYAYMDDRLGVPHYVMRSDNTTVWSGDFYGFGSPISINDDPDGDGKHLTVTDVPFRLPGQIALTTQEAGPSYTAGGIHENRYRLYDSTTGRYLEPDPLFAGAPNVYTYADDSPFRAIDPTGLDPYQLFTSADAAAADALNYYYQQSVNSDQEVGGTIIALPGAGEGGNPLYTYGPGTWGPPGGGQATYPVPLGPNFGGLWHTHACQGAGQPSAENFSNPANTNWATDASGNLSNDESNIFRIDQISGFPFSSYMVTPTGQMKVFTPNLQNPSGPTSPSGDLPGTLGGLGFVRALPLTPGGECSCKK